MEVLTFNEQNTDGSGGTKPPESLYNGQGSEMKAKGGEEKHDPFIRGDHQDSGEEKHDPFIRGDGTAAEVAAIHEQQAPDLGRTALTA